MFGYVRINKQELLVKDYEAYRASYCGLCKTLGKRYSVFSRALLNYDFTFYALLLQSLSPCDVKICRQGCLFNPLSKRKCCVYSTELEKAADALILTSYFKLDDSIADSGAFKRFFYRIIKLLMKSAMKKAKKASPDVYEMLSEYMIAQRETEKDGSAGIDKASEPTARLMSKLLPAAAEDEHNKRVLESLGYNIGKWIYITDAADDYYGDVKHKRFNPIKNEFGSASAAAQNVTMTLNICVNEAAKAVDLLKLYRNEMIVKNVIYMGMPALQGRVISKLKRENEDGTDESL